MSRKFFVFVYTEPLVEHHTEISAQNTFTLPVTVEQNHMKINGDNNGLSTKAVTLVKSLFCHISQFCEKKTKKFPVFFGR